MSEISDFEGLEFPGCDFRRSKFCESLEALILLDLNGAPERIRTSDLCLRRKLLFEETHDLQQFKIKKISPVHVFYHG